MKKLNLFVLAAILLPFLAGCGAPAQATAVPGATPTAALAPSATPANVTLKVFAPSSMTEASKDINTAFEAAYPGIKVAVEFGHTPTQRLQFKQGATGDVFMTASQKDMDDAMTDESVATGQARVFAMNRLVVILPAKNPANIQTLADLAKPGTRLLIAVADTPIGKVTLDVLDKMEKQLGAGYKAKVLANVVSTESGVKPIVSKIKLGEADAGVVYVTDRVSAPELLTIEIPDPLNSITQLNIAPLAKAANLTYAEKYTAFVTSQEGAAILKKWGFLPGKP